MDPNANEDTQADVFELLMAEADRSADGFDERLAEILEEEHARARAEAIRNGEDPDEIF